MEKFEAHRMKWKITIHQNMSNFEALHWVISSSSIKLLFLKSDILRKNDGHENTTIIILKQT